MQDSFNVRACIPGEREEILLDELMFDVYGVAEGGDRHKRTDCAEHNKGH